MKEPFDFLKTVEPFNLLPDDVLHATVDLLREVKYNKDGVIYEQETSKLKGVDIIVEGKYESFFYDSSQNKRVVEEFFPGACYGGTSVLLNQKKSLRTVWAQKGTVVYMLPRKDFRVLCQAYEAFFQHFTTAFGKRMLNDEFSHFFKNPTSYDKNQIGSEEIYSKKIESIEYTNIVGCDEDTPIYEAAKMMAAYKLSCLFVKDKTGKIIGYLTDISIRDNVVAKQIDFAIPVNKVMDNPIVTIKPEAYLYEAVLKMFRYRIRYMLVEKNGEYLGFISRNKLLNEQQQSPLAFIQSVRQAISVDELKRKWENVPEIVLQLINRGVYAEIVNQVITAVSDTIAIKVIEAVIKELGTPPAKFVFMVLGSEGRKEQTLKTDQDNAIIYEDKANEHREEVRKYFLAFAARVSDKLNHIGFVYCTGDYMAKNPKWTHSLSHWKRNYEDWMTASVPETVIQISTFFDCRYLYGEESIMGELKEFLGKELQKPMEKLFYFMAKNALQYEPPLTPFFKNIKTFKVGELEVFDIKKAMTPIVDLVRMYTLKNKIFELNTGERIKALKDADIFNETESQELLQSYYILMSMRLKRHATQIIQDKTEPDNYIHLDSLTKIERLTLKQIFKTIENFQSKIKIAFTGTL